MRILWTHSFPPHRISSGVFMHLLVPELLAVGVNVELHYTGRLRSLRAIARAARTIRRLSHSFDVVHAQYGSGCGWVSSFAKCPKILTLRGSDLYGVETGPVSARLHGAFGRSLTRWTLPSYSHVIVVSQHMRAHVGPFANSIPVDVLPSGIDFRRFQPIDRMEARRRLGLKHDDQPWVLVADVTPNNPVKRRALTTAAFELLKRRLPGARLKVTTGIPHERMPLWVNACNVVLVTSTHEGWPNIVKEALACGVPFVSTDVSDLKAIADAEPSCVVTDPDPERLARGMLDAIEHSPVPALRRHVAWMEVTAIAQRHIEIYERLSGASRARSPEQPGRLVA